jgi:dTDP-4-dehydrorhamnose 3,5-epimerase-like enzyme
MVQRDARAVRKSHVETRRALRLDVGVFDDSRGGLGVLEFTNLPWQPKRVYYLFDVPAEVTRAGHAHLEEEEVLIAVRGSFTVLTQTRQRAENFRLEAPSQAILIPRLVWHELVDFAPGSICLAIASQSYDRGDYIEDLETYLSYA